MRELTGSKYTWPLYLRSRFNPLEAASVGKISHILAASAGSFFYCSLIVMQDFLDKSFYYILTVMRGFYAISFFHVLTLTVRKTIFSFSGLPEKMIFPKRLRWNMIFLVLSEKMMFLFPENMILHVGREMKDDLS